MDDYKGNKVEETLLIAKEDWQGIFNTVNDSITIHDAEFNVIHMNESAKRMLGLQLQEEITLAKCFRLYHGADKPPANCPSCQSLKTGRPSAVEIFEPFLDKHLEIRAMPIVRDDGRLVGLVHIVRDITERKGSEKRLQQSYDKLEQRVTERTDQLIRVNEELCKEINERKRAEEELRESENKYRSLASTVDSLILVDKNCRYLFANETFLKRYATLKSSIIGKKFDELYDEETSRIFAAAVKLVFETGNPYQDEAFSKGRARYLLRTFSPVKQADGSIAAVTVVSKDITDRKEAEKSLRESEEKYRALASTVDLLILVDKSCSYLFANESYLDQFGAMKGSVIGRKYEEFHNQETSKIFADKVKWVFETGNPHQDEWLGTRSARYWLRTFSPIKNNEGNVYATIVAAKDITDRKYAEEALKKSEERLRSIYDNSPLALGFIDQAGNLVDFNDAHVRIIGTPREALIGFNLKEHIGDPGLKAALMKAFSGTMGTFEGKYKTVTSEKTLYLRTFFVPVLNENGAIQGVQFLAEDVTERKRLEEELHDSNTMLEKLVKERTAELEIKNRNLEEMNIALTVLLQKRGEDKKNVEERIVSNIRNLVYPYVEKMKNDSLSAKNHLLLSIIENHLNELLSPLLKNMQQFNLTPKELQIASMVKDGRTTKEIAEVLGVETSSIDTHRNSIRKKLGLNRNVNLQSKLKSLQ